MNGATSLKFEISRNPFDLGHRTLQTKVNMGINKAWDNDLSRGFDAFAGWWHERRVANHDHSAAVYSD